MSFWDNVKKFAQPYADEEYDDYDEEEYVAPEDDYLPPEPPERKGELRVADDEIPFE